MKENDLANRSVMLTLTEVREGEEAWVPSSIHLTKGESVELIVVNGDDEFEHRLAIPGLDILTEIIPPGNQQIIIYFDANITGVFKFNDPDSPVNCETVPPEEVSRRDMFLSFERLIDNLYEATTLNEMKNVIIQLEQVLNQYSSIVPNDITNAIEKLKELLSIDEAEPLVEEFNIALDKLEGSLLPACIQPGQIIIEE